MKPTLLLIGERALELRERLEASGYDTVGWSGNEAIESIGAGLVPQERVKAALITSDELEVVPLLQKSCGAGVRVPLLVEAMADDLAALDQLLSLGHHVCRHGQPPILGAPQLIGVDHGPERHHAAFAGAVGEEQDRAT